MEWVLVGAGGHCVGNEWLRAKGGVREKAGVRLRMGENSPRGQPDGGGVRWGIRPEKPACEERIAGIWGQARRHKGVRRPGARPRAGRTLSESSSGSSWQQRRHRKDLGSRPRVCLVVTK